MNRTIKTITSLLALVAVLALAAGCSDQGTITLPDDNAAAPELPPTTTMKFELDFFAIPTPNVDQSLLVQGKPADYPLAQAAGDHENWINAFIRAVYVQLTIYDALEEPIGAFALAIHSVPQHQEDGSYLWTYIFVDAGTEYSIFLYGTPQTDRVLWRMEVSTNNPDFLLDHFVWFDGEVMKGHDSGYWQFYAPVFDAPAVAAGAAPTEGTPLIRVDWDNTASEHRMTVSVNGVGVEDEGDYVEFYSSPSTGKIDFYDASEDLLSNITWHADGSGSLTVPDYNGGATACWDTQQRNVVCP